MQARGDHYIDYYGPCDGPSSAEQIRKQRRFEQFSSAESTWTKGRSLLLKPLQKFNGCPLQKIPPFLIVARPQDGLLLVLTRVHFIICRLVCLSFILFFTFLAGNSHGHFTGKGHVHTFSETRQVFSNSNCAAADTCDLKRFTLTTSVYEVWFSDDPNHPTYGNGVIMEYETDAVDALEKYAIVQFVKGCVFESSQNGNGKIDRNFSYVVPSFGERIPFCFPHWVIDSHDTDPAYNSDPEYGRFYLLRWNRPGSYDRQTQKYYGTEKPKNPVVYMTDYPDGAFVTGTGVKNAALEFKTCIYKSADVPAATQRDDIHFARPITCFQWQNVYVYDFAKGTFQTDLANIPRWEEPLLRVNVYLMVIFITLFIALAVIIFSHMGKFLTRKTSFLSLP